MMRYCGVTLCLLVSLAAGDFDCVKKSVADCDIRFYLKHDPRTLTFCKTYPHYVQCHLDAALECQTGFENNARRTLNVITQICTEGTPYNNVLKNDPNCGIGTIQNSEKCMGGLVEELRKLPSKHDFIEDRRIQCKWYDHIKNCMYKKFESQCTQDSQNVLRDLYETSLEFEKDICKLLPAA